MINSHIKKLLTEEKYGTGISSMKRFNIPPLQIFIHLWKTEAITMKSLSSFENTTLKLSITFEFIENSPLPNLEFKT